MSGRSSSGYWIVAAALRSFMSPKRWAVWRKRFLKKWIEVIFRPHKICGM
jgi:hypothetical protein